MKKVLNLIKKNIFGIIIGLIFGSVSVYAGTKFYAGDVSVDSPAGSNLGSGATLQNSLDELYSIADKYDELNKKINSMLDKMYPVGSIYISTSITTASDVATKFGGTWEAYGTGKTLVGVDTNDTNFNMVSKTGGSSTTTLTTSNIPSHNHTYSGTTDMGTISGYNNSGWPSATATNAEWQYDWHHYDTSFPYTSWFFLAHTHTYSGTTTSCVNCQGTSFTNLQPYITVYMYKRIK